MISLALSLAFLPSLYILAAHAANVPLCGVLRVCAAWHGVTQLGS